MEKSAKRPRRCVSPRATTRVGRLPSVLELIARYLNRCGDGPEPGRCLPGPSPPFVLEAPRRSCLPDLATRCYDRGVTDEFFEPRRLRRWFQEADTAGGLTAIMEGADVVTAHQQVRLVRELLRLPVLDDVLRLLRLGVVGSLPPVFYDAAASGDPAAGGWSAAAARLEWSDHALLSRLPALVEALAEAALRRYVGEGRRRWGASARLRSTCTDVAILVAATDETLFYDLTKLWRRVASVGVDGLSDATRRRFEEIASAATDDAIPLVAFVDTALDLDPLTGGVRPTPEQRGALLVLLHNGPA